MDPEQIDKPNHELELFQERFTAGFKDVLEFFEPDDSFLVLQPSDMNIPEDPRFIDDLSEQERMAIGEIAFNQLGIDVNTSIVRVYSMAGPPREDGTPSQTNVTVFRTDRENGISVHKVEYEDRSVLYALGPEDMEF